LRQSADAICEKPLVLNPWNVDALAEIEKETGKKIYTILQLRLHSSIIALREKIQKGPSDKVYNVDLRYITSRGNWYHSSWKGENSKSGGIATNIGVHFFDMLIWVFGAMKEHEVTTLNDDHAAGRLILERANINWFLSINRNHLPDDVAAKGKSTYRSLTLESEEVEFSDGFTDLHTASYQHILNGHGFGLQDAKPSIELVHNIRNSYKH
jgi:UDP-N-acetyl-2-amino-2-deoxyglucuronate dehydrogenase